MNNTVPPPTGSAPIDLITNGSFQVWQRGNNVSGNTMQIGPDMWSGNGNLSRIYTKSADGCAIAATQSGAFMGISQKIEWSKALNDMAVAAGCLTLIYKYMANQPCIDYQGNRCTQAYVWYTTLAVVPFTAADGDTAMANGYYNLADRIGINCLLNGDPLPVGFSFTVRYVRCLIGAYTLNSVPPYVPPDPILELIKCKKYFIKPDVSWKTAWFEATGRYLLTSIPLPGPMRITPSLVYSSAPRIYAGGWRDLPSDARVQSDANEATIWWSATIMTDIALTAGSSYLVQNQPALSAEL